MDNKLKNFVRRHKKGLLIGIPLTLATIFGTYTGTEGGFPPFHNNKVGTSVGLNVGIVTKFNPGSKFYGASISFYTINEGKINGLELSAANVQVGDSSCTNGIQASFLNAGSQNPDSSYSYPNVNGVQIGIIGNAARGNVLQIAGLVNDLEGKSKGIQIAIGANHAREEADVIQAGIYNHAVIDSSKVKKGFLINYKITGEGN